MDALQFDQYTQYSDDSNSAPRTPSPITMSHYHPKDSQQVDNPYTQAPDQAFWPAPPFQQYAHRPPGHSGSLLQELYEGNEAGDHYGAGEPPLSGHSDWSQMAHEQQMHIQAQQQHAQQMAQQQHAAHHAHRRNTFPIVRTDGRDAPQHAAQQFFPPFMGHDHHVYPVSRAESLYEQAHSHSLMGSGSRPSTAGADSYMSSSPRAFDGGVKLEDAPVIVPSQTAFYRPSSSHAHLSGSLLSNSHPQAHLAAHQLHAHQQNGHSGQQGGGANQAYLSPHTGLPVQHTDDAASKETQYLRRRCFNCHTTEPPSWRRSTLNPGKIVCNKCGLYERTHLRPRPLRFDELRAGNKARKQPPGGVVGGIAKSPSPKGLVKKEPRESAGFGLVRRSSVSSTASSTNGASSDWDDNVSVYSNGSNPGSAYNSPAVATFPIPRDGASASPPLPGGGIRLPANPLTDLGAQMQVPGMPLLSLQQQSQQKRHHTAPGAGAGYSYPTPPTTAAGGLELRRGSMPVDLTLSQDPTQGWEAEGVQPQLSPLPALST